MRASHISIYSFVILIKSTRQLNLCARLRSRIQSLCLINSKQCNNRLSIESKRSHFTLAMFYFLNPINLSNNLFIWRFSHFPLASCFLQFQRILRIFCFSLHCNNSPIVIMRMPVIEFSCSIVVAVISDSNTHHPFHFIRSQCPLHIN